MRLAAPPASLPSYVHLDNASNWMTTALLCAGVESFTLPSRLAADAGKRGSLSLLQDTLNTTDTQNLFELHASVSASRKGTNGTSGQGTNGHTDSRDANSPEVSQLDFDYSPSLSSSSVATSSHIFAQVECERDHLESETRPLTMSPDERLRRRFNEETVVEM